MHVIWVQRVVPVLKNPGGSEFSVVCLDEVVALRSHLPERAEIFVVRSPPVGTDLLKA